MIDNILIAIILLLFIISFLVVHIWKKKNYVKEVYISSGVSLLLYLITLFITVGLILCYYILSKGLQYSWKCLLIVLLLDIIMLLVYCINASLCISLNDNNFLCKKTIFIKKEIKIDNETKIIEKIDKIIIKSQNKSIILDLRYLSGSVNNMRYKIKQIINEQTNGLY